MEIKYAVDLLWVRPKKVGGIESYIRNLLDGFMKINDNFELWLLVSKDNADTFYKYNQDKRFNIYICDVNSANVGKRIIWQNFNLGRTIKKLGLNMCFEPYYCKPIFGCSGINFITTIHDLQALHYPEYFSIGKVAWMKLSWWNAVRTSKKIIAISKYVREDIIAHYGFEKKVFTIYNPIVVDTTNIIGFEQIKDKYGIEQQKYYFTVSSLLPHKNLCILLEVMKMIKNSRLELPHKLIVSGVGGKSKGELEKKIIRYGLVNDVIMTPFIDDDERNTLYKNCKAFLFPSVFEGFGMPPVEAMMFGVPVITTRKTSLEEVTQGKAKYVDKPYCVDEWIKVMTDQSKLNILDFSYYSKEKIAKMYLKHLKI